MPPRVLGNNIAVCPFIGLDEISSLFAGSD
jgi:hypothetical protein